MKKFITNYGALRNGKIVKLDEPQTVKAIDKKEASLKLGVPAAKIREFKEGE